MFSFKPKFFVGSPGFIWGSEFIQLRWLEPQKFDVSDQFSNQSKEFKSICILLCDALKYFIDSSEEDDVSNLTTNVTNPNLTTNVTNPNLTTNVTNPK